MPTSLWPRSGSFGSGWGDWNIGSCYFVLKDVVVLLHAFVK